jgi:23S rRNA (adenine2030-N6)-methyltransferase
MLSYRHAFHAGSAADVLKHAVLVFTLRHLLKKPKALYVLDTHAGAGAYDLASAMALKTGEFRAGIAALMASGDEPPALLGAYLELVRAANLDGRLDVYPGSPILMRRLLRPCDRLELAELHPTDHDLLRARLESMARVRVERTHGLALLVARMPPPERRGLVLIDPSYEMKKDYEAVVRALARGHRQFPTGVFLLWYPVIDRGRVDSLLGDLAQTGIPAQYRIELCQRPDAPGLGLTGSGLIVVNPPWTLLNEAPPGIAWLATTLQATGPFEAGWLTPERTGRDRTGAPISASPAGWRRRSP